MPDPLVFFVPGSARTTQLGDVIPVGHPNAQGQRRHIPIRKNTAWSAYVGLAAKEAAKGRPLFIAPVKVEMEFRIQAPKKLKCLVPMTRPDLENLYKGLLDQFNGVVWIDDNQVQRLEAERIYATLDLPPGVLFRITELDPARWMTPPPLGRQRRGAHAPGVL